MIFQYPLAQPFLMLIERQVPMLGFAHDGSASAESRFRMDEFGRAKRCTARLALVAVRIGVSAMRAGSRDITVGKELFGFRIVKLFALLFDKFTFIIESPEKLSRRLTMDFGCGTRIDIECDTEVLKRFLDERMITVYDILRGNAFAARPDGDRHSMFVGAADKNDFFPF